MEHPNAQNLSFLREIHSLYWLKKPYHGTPSGGTQATLYLVNRHVEITTQPAGAGVSYNVGDVVSKKPLVLIK